MTTITSQTSLNTAKGSGTAKPKGAKKSASKKSTTLTVERDEDADFDEDAPKKPTKAPRFRITPLAKIAKEYQFDVSRQGYFHRELPLGFFCLEPAPSHVSSWNGGEPVQFGAAWSQKLADTVALSYDPAVLKAQAELFHLLKEAFGEDLIVATYSLKDIDKGTIVEDDSPAFPLLATRHKELLEAAAKATPPKVETKAAKPSKAPAPVEVDEKEAPAADALAEPQSAPVSAPPPAPSATDVREQLAADLETLANNPGPAQADAQRLIDEASPDRPLVEGLRALGLTTPAALIAWARKSGVIAAPPRGEGRPKFGIIDYLAELAQRPEGVTVQEAAELVKVRFPDREAGSMAQTCKIQLGGKGDKAGSRIAQDRKLVIKVVEDPARGRVIYGTKKASA